MKRNLPAEAIGPNYSTSFYVGSFLIVLLLCLPTYFNNYRLLATDAVPADSYFQMVQYWAGDRSEDVLVDPTSYRVALPLLAVIPYRFLPPLRLNRLGSDTDLQRVRAVQAITLVNFVGVVFALFTTLLLILQQGLPRWISWLTMGIVFYFMNYMALAGIDPWAVAWLNLLLLSKRLWVYLLLLLVSVAMNEKIAMAMLLFHIPYWFFERRRSFPSRGLFAVVALAIYFSIRQVYPLGGHEYMFTPSRYYDSILASLALLFSVKGLYMNVFPLLLILLLYYLTWKNRLFDNTPNNSWCCLFVFVGFFVIGLVTRLEYTIGRLALHGLSFFIVPIGLLLWKFFTVEHLAKTVENVEEVW